MSEVVDLAELAARADLEQELDRLARSHGIIRTRQLNQQETWTVLGAALTRQLLSDPRLSNDVHTHAPHGALVPGMPVMLLEQDGPDHARYRRLVTAAFASRAVRELEPRIVTTTRRLLDALGDSGTADFIEAFTYPMPLEVICDLLGVPDEEREPFRTWAMDIRNGDGRTVPPAHGPPATPLAAPARPRTGPACRPPGVLPARGRQRWRLPPAARRPGTGGPYDPDRAVRDVRRPVSRDMAELAARAFRAVLPLTDRPLTLLGHSMGAVVAYEVVRRLESAGAGPAHLIVSGAWAPDRVRDRAVRLRDDDGLVDELRRTAGTDPRLLRHPEVLAMALPVLRSDYTALETYRHRPGRPLTTPVTSLVGDADPVVGVPEAAAWERHTRGPFRLRVFPGGDHGHWPDLAEHVCAQPSPEPLGAVRTRSTA
ncbi:thioesterase domain-containing protein [Streptomyces sp. NPDC052682]|uniref:thioesterase domain-containing protein n=1 Tax=Streptomyces sp. NPDC052682 TaxID=3154954 RepID=UPI00341EA7A6